MSEIDQDTLARIRSAIRYNEIGKASPYLISFASKGNSGGSFGAYQGDAHADQPHVTNCLTAVLLADGVDAGEAARIVGLVAGVCVENPLSDADTRRVNSALSSDKGKALVDAMDGELEQTVTRGVQQCMAAAQARGVNLQQAASLYVACWTNMTGAPKQLARWLGGATTYQLAAPQGPDVSGYDVERYLLKTDYFARNPRNFDHLKQCIQLALHPDGGGA